MCFFYNKIFFHSFHNSGFSDCIYGYSNAMISLCKWFAFFIGVYERSILISFVSRFSCVCWEHLDVESWPPMLGKIIQFKTYCLWFDCLLIFKWQLIIDLPFYLMHFSELTLLWKNATWKLFYSILFYSHCYLYTVAIIILYTHTHTHRYFPL